LINVANRKIGKGGQEKGKERQDRVFAVNIRVITGAENCFSKPRTSFKERRGRGKKRGKKRKETEDTLSHHQT